MYKLFIVVSHVWFKSSFIFVFLHHSRLPHMRRAFVSPSSPLMSRLTSWHPRSRHKHRLQSLRPTQIYLHMKIYLKSHKTHKIPITLLIKAQECNLSSAGNEQLLSCRCADSWLLTLMSPAGVCENLLCLQRTPK